MSTRRPDTGAGLGGPADSASGARSASEVAAAGSARAGAGRGRRAWQAAAVLVLAVAAGVIARSLWPSSSRPVASGAAGLAATVTVERADVSERQDVPGTLGYRGSFSVVNELAPGILTWVPAAGRVVRRGQILYRLAGQPVTLFYGRVPAWRPLAPGMPSGPDVRELQRNLAALGFDPGHEIVPDGTFGWATEAAVCRWQRAHGVTVTGTVPLGAATFLPGPLRVSHAASPPGIPAAPGTRVLSGTSATPSVSVSLSVGGPQVRPGDRVAVTMPDGTTMVPGTVTSVGRVAAAPAPSAQGAGGTQTATIPVTVRIGRSRLAAGLDQAPVQVAITSQRHRGVLAVPVTALLARPGGGYALLAAAGRTRRLIPVATGLFDDATGLVEVSGQGLAPGLAVEAAQG